MPLEIITNLIPVTDDMDFSTKEIVQSYNDQVLDVAEQLRNSPVNNLDPKDGRIFKLTLTANIDKPMSLEREFILP